MSRIVVDSQEMRRLASKLERLADEYQYIVQNELYGKVVDGIRRCYNGVDADAMIHGLEEFRSDLLRMKKVVDQYAGYIRNAARKYDETQDELAAKAAAELADSVK